MRNYLNLMARVLEDGGIRQDRTGIGTLSLYGISLEFDLAEGFPAVTTKRLAFRQVAAELCCFLRGYEWLEEFHSVGCTVWDANACAPSWLASRHCLRLGHLGRTYGVQWRRWQRANGTIVDQLAEAERLLREEPWGRRAVVTAWNPAELDRSCLPPCHHSFQLSARAGGRLDCFAVMRSVDVFLGLPFDVASYALLTHIVAQDVGLVAGRLFMAFGDAHVYLNHLDQCQEQLRRKPCPPPTLRLDPAAGADNFHPDMAGLLMYEHRGAITGDLNI